MKKTYILLAATTIAVSSAFVMKVMLKGPDQSSMDKKADPRQDFYQYANGNWVKNNPVPASESRWTSFNIVAERNNDMLRKILEDAAADMSAPYGSARQRVGDLYRCIMDTVRLDKDGYLPIKPLLQEVDAIANYEDIIKNVAKQHRTGMDPLFGFGVSPDVRNSEVYAVYASQSGLGLPDRDYYTKEDEKSQQIRTDYVKHIMRMFELIGYNKAEANSAALKIMDFETRLAKVSMTRVERRDIEKQYNKKSLAELQKLTPMFSWETYFTATGLKQKKFDSVIVMQPKFMEQVSLCFTDFPLSAWKAYLKWNILNTTAGMLSSDLEKQNFAFYSTTLSGQKEQKPRWKRAIGTVNGFIGELAAQEYVKVAFSPESKQRVNEMVNNLMAVYKKRLENVDWMSAETRQRALEKLATMGRKLGYPDKWEEYKGLEIKNDSYVNNFMRTSEWQYNDNINKLGTPIDRAKWGMLPQTVNAYYTPLLNEIVFPAAILQPPFFNAEADDAVNYGSMGAVIGHEISHGFDDKGSKFDAKGNLNNWWTAEDRTKFEAKTKILVNQFNKFKVGDSLYVNGELTLGENIADLAGLSVAYEAYLLSLEGKPKENMDGLSPEQRFFVGFAQVWKNNARPEFTRNQVMTDPHSPGKFRVLGPLSNMPEFYNAFGVKEGDKMWRPETDRAKIW